MRAESAWFYRMGDRAALSHVVSSDLATWKELLTRMKRERRRTQRSMGRL